MSWPLWTVFWSSLFVFALGTAVLQNWSMLGSRRDYRKLAYRLFCFHPVCSPPVGGSITWSLKTEVILVCLSRCSFISVFDVILVFLSVCRGLSSSDVTLRVCGIYCVLRSPGCLQKWSRRLWLSRFLLRLTTPSCVSCSSRLARRTFSLEAVCSSHAVSTVHVFLSCSSSVCPLISSPPLDVLMLFVFYLYSSPGVSAI